MSATYQIDVERQIVLTTYLGRLTDTVLIAHQENLRADPHFRPHFRQLCDIRAVDTVEVTPQCIRQLATANPFGGGAKRALVTRRDLVYGFARMFEMLTDTPFHETHVFSDIAEARQWLGLDG